MKKRDHDCDYRTMLENLYWWFDGRSLSFQKRAGRRLWEEARKLLSAPKRGKGTK